MWTKGKWITDNPNTEMVAIMANGVYDYICDCDSDYVNRPQKECQANAERICQCVNGWDDLVAERDELRKCHESELGVCQEHCDVVKEITEQRDKLLEHVKKLLAAMKFSGWSIDDDRWNKPIKEAKAYIAACKES